MHKKTPGSKRYLVLWVSESERQERHSFLLVTRGIEFIVGGGLQAQLLQFVLSYPVDISGRNPNDMVCIRPDRAVDFHLSELVNQVFHIRLVSHRFLHALLRVLMLILPYFLHFVKFSSLSFLKPLVFLT